MQETPRCRLGSFGKTPSPRRPEFKSRPAARCGARSQFSPRLEQLLLATNSHCRSYLSRNRGQGRSCCCRSRCSCRHQSRATCSLPRRYACCAKSRPPARTNPSSSLANTPHAGASIPDTQQPSTDADACHIRASRCSRTTHIATSAQAESPSLSQVLRARACAAQHDRSPLSYMMLRLQHAYSSLARAIFASRRPSRYAHRLVKQRHGIVAQRLWSDRGGRFRV